MQKTVDLIFAHTLAGNAFQGYWNMLSGIARFEEDVNLEKTCDEEDVC